MRYRRFFNLANDLAPLSEGTIGGIEIYNPGPTNPNRAPCVLPLLPIWPRLAINTLLYAVSSWLVIGGPLTFRRWRRYRRGACIKCAYDLRHVDHEVCPECGTAVSSTASSKRSN